MNDMLLVIRNLKFQWTPSSLQLLSIPEFHIKKGEKVFLHGPSGSGKSTFLNLISGVLPSQSGSIHFLNTSLSSLRPYQRDLFRGDHMGFIFQQFNLIPYLSVIENVLLPLEFSSVKKNKTPNAHIEAQRLLKTLGLSSFQNSKATDLSVGQQQRVAVARALMGQPELIIADEPTSALDADHRNQFLELILSETQKTNSSLLFVSHDTSLRSHFDRTLSLDEDVNQRIRTEEFL